MPYIVKVDDKEFKVNINNEGNIFKILLNNKEINAEIISGDNDNMVLVVDNKPYSVVFDSDNQLSINGEEYTTSVIDEALQKIMKSISETEHKEITISAPMPGLVIEVEMNEGDTVKAGQGVLILEAMKMQNEIKSPKNGIVKKIFVKKGQAVNSKEALFVIE